MDLNDNARWHWLFQSTWLVAESMANSRGGAWATILMPGMRPHAERLISPAGVRTVIAGMVMRRAERDAAINQLRIAKRDTIEAFRQYADATKETLAAHGQLTLLAGGTLLSEVARLPNLGSLKRDALALADMFSTMGRATLPSTPEVEQLLLLRAALAGDVGNVDLREQLFDLESR